MADKRFIILEEIGKGGHGKVYRARDEQLDRVVAIKVFHDLHPEGVRLMKEARTLCQLAHAGIVNVYDVSKISITEGNQTTITLSEDEGAQDEKSAWAMIMEDLGDIDPLQYVIEKGDHEALRIAAEIADALQFAHHRGIFHCDLNNSNVHIVCGKAKVFDFSLAAREPGRPYGTPAFRAPEQTHGEEPSDRTDVYGLGRLLYGLLKQDPMMKAPADGSKPVLPRHSQLDWRTRQRIENLIHRMLARDPRERPSMEHVAQVCRNSIRPMTSWQSLWAGGAAALLLLLALSGAVMFGKNRLRWLTGAYATTSMPFSDTFTVTIRVQGAANDSAWLSSSAGAKVLIDLGTDRRVGILDVNGEATFREVPTRFRGQHVPLAVQIPGYVTADPKGTYFLSDQPVFISLKPEDMPIPARLRVAVGVIHRGKDILMVRRLHKEGKLSWQFPAGIVKPLQAPEQRVVDETLKETGISVKVLDKIGERISPDTKVHAIYFDCAYLAGNVYNGEPNENAEVEWVPVADVEGHVTSSLYQGVLDVLRGIQHDDPT